MESGTILVIDDEPVIRAMAQALLSDLGFDVLLAENGKIGFEIYQKEQKNIGAVILDLVMPVMSGKETFELLLEENPDVKVIIASGFSREDRIAEFKKMGAVIFLKKPYKQEEIERVLKSI